MEYVQKAVYGPEHELSHLMYDRIHGSDGNKTLCGILLNENWFVTGNSEKVERPISCPKCKAKMQEE